MEEMQQSFLNTDPDSTLVPPRFDAAEAQTAQPVVPLARVTARQSRLPVALVLVSALLGGLVSVAAYRLFLRPTPTQETVHTGVPADVPKTMATPAPQASPLLTASAPVTSETARAETPAPAAESKPEASAPVVVATTRAIRDEEKAAREQADARQKEERAARETETRRDTSRTVRDEAPRARRVEVIPTYPDGERVGNDRRRNRDDEATDYQLPRDQGEGRRGGGGGRRARGRNIDRIRDIFGAPPPG